MVTIFFIPSSSGEWKKELYSKMINICHFEVSGSCDKHMYFNSFQLSSLSSWLSEKIRAVRIMVWHNFININYINLSVFLIESEFFLSITFYRNRKE